MVILSSSTSSSEASARRAQWQRFVRVAAAALLGMVVVCYGFVLLVDPYDNLPFSPGADRAQVTTAQRFFYPALARKPRFDSAIIGNSSVRLLRPAQLNELLDGKFVNLGLNAASSWEQSQIFGVFQRSHAEISNLLIGIDGNWCREQGTEERFQGSIRAAEFPEWMYDDWTFNNLPRLNSITLQHAWKQLQIIAGWRDRSFGADGYTVFTGPISAYDLDKARLNIYGSTRPLERAPQIPPVEMSQRERSEIPLPALSRLQGMLDALPGATRKILLIVPSHSYAQPRPGSRQEIVWAECKARLVEMASARANVFVLDFRIRSDITSKDSNYWDATHYTVEVAETLGTLIGAAVNQRLEGENYRLLHATPDPPVISADPKIRHPRDR